MNNWKKYTALGLAAMMTLSMAGCGSSNTDTTAPAAEDTSAKTETATTEAKADATDDSSAPGDKRIINIGSWWTQYYDSSHTSVEDDPSYSGLDVAHLKFDNVAKIEEKYNCEFYWKNLTYAGVQESINNSILAGDPDCDIYMVELSFGIPAALNGLATDMKTILPADDDLFTTQQNIKYLDLGDGKACILKRVEAASTVEATYPLGFNKQMLEDNNLEDPRDLYERGEWTWDKFIEYCKVLTQDTDGDGQIDQYGYCGYENETFEQLMMSNGANIASGQTETLSSAGVAEALQMMSDMYNVYNVCYPYDFEGTPSDSMRNQYTEGNIGFFPIAAWIASGNGDYDYDGSKGATLPFDTAYVRWPVGPSGNKDTNAGKNLTAGEFYIIPAGVVEPEKVYNVLYDMWNWFDGDTSIRDDRKALNWWYGVTAKTEELQNANFDVMKECGANTTFDLWNSMGFEYDLQSLIKGETTPAQFQETYKQQVQDGLDAFYK